MTIQLPQSDLRRLFIEGMSRVASAVAVVTTDGEAGRFGVTVSSMTSVSADTQGPSLLVSVHHMSPACEAIRRNGRFCANVLSGNQSRLSDLFSGRLKPETRDRFEVAAWHGGTTGAPILDGAVVAFDCVVRTALFWGTHCIFIGEAEQIEISEQRSPLVYANRGYRRAVPIAAGHEARSSRREELRIGCFVTLGPQFVPSLIVDFAAQYPDVDIRLLEADHDDLVEQLRAGTIDTAVSFRFAPAADLRIGTIRDAAPHVLLATDHPLADRARLSLADLAGQPMVLLDYPSVRNATAQLFRRSSLDPDIRFQSPSFEMVRGLVAHGFGYSLVPQRPSDLVATDGKRLVPVPLTDAFPEAAVVALLRPDILGNEKMQDFLSRCRKLVG